MAEVNADSPRIPRVGPPRMSPLEVALFRQVAAGARYCVEFGCGGSTLEFLRLGVEKIVSVESDRAWLQALARVPDVAPAVASGRLALLHADIGPVRSWGYPDTKEHKHKWPDYARMPWPHYEEWPDEPTIVLVDGRFRVACCLNAAETAVKNGRNMTKILFHDFQPDRPRYERVLEFCNIEDRCEGLVVLTPRHDADPTALSAVKHKFERIPQ